MRSGTDLAPGTRLGSYTVEAVVGRGGMGVVYLARHVALGRTVALKVLAPELSEDAGFRERFIREAQLAASLDHPNIIPIYDAGEADGRLFMAMRYVSGVDLGHVVKDGGTLSPPRAVEILTQVASALDAAHDRGLVHRDVKPANIFVQPPSAKEPERVYLGDFGLTKSTASQSQLTKTGFFVGTLDYAAPEQIQGKPVDGRADEYSLGCVLYECLAGGPPFQRDSDAQVMAAHLFDAPPRLSVRRLDVPEGMDEVLAKAMAKEPSGRYPSCGALMIAANAALASRQQPFTTGERAPTLAAIPPLPPVPAPPTGPLTPPPIAVPASADAGPTHRRRRGLVIAGAVAAVVIAGGGVAVALLGGSKSGPQAVATTSASASPSPSLTPTTTTTATTTTPTTQAPTGLTVSGYIGRVDGLLLQSGSARRSLVQAVNRAAFGGRGAAAAAIPIVQGVLNTRHRLIQTVDAVGPPPQASAANALLSQAFKDSLADDALYLTAVREFAAGNLSAGRAELQAVNQQSHTTTDPTKQEFLREFNALRSSVGEPPLPSTFPF